MAEGERAAEKTKAAFQQAGEATEGLRKNINSFANTLVSGDKTTTPTQHSTTGTTGTANTTSTPNAASTTSTHPDPYPRTSTGIHPDAKKTGDELAKGAGKVAGHMENFAEKHSKTGNTGAVGRTPGGPRPGEVRPGETVQGEKRPEDPKPGETTIRDTALRETGPTGGTTTGETRPPHTEDRT